ncbi:hypothetical protein TTHERM_00532480 (macronuclear) [Tetrahymena thermophila SB210]|uniref:Uncharacterized protein n=1 Tax=Tetrahymena thermophila (strain SB210) TaxID=312017 RepID=Q248C1_TETTS|nr:hypothetical protein TTHERM_00532480 [Tetrahymena thermophila SB210]EAS04124.1 hypothetical protein TTHERM_00532480 [Tetrahymena thermophila SB210]|eukprot:XP_001024369.1 hypothetical protein TTHERM_00532480 [Tetrahymena thermophila SB210]
MVLIKLLLVNITQYNQNTEASPLEKEKSFLVSPSQKVTQQNEIIMTIRVHVDLLVAE